MGYGIPDPVHSAANKRGQQADCDALAACPDLQGHSYASNSPTPTLATREVAVDDLLDRVIMSASTIRLEVAGCRGGSVSAGEESRLNLGQ